jgi:hypothetical protein
MVCHTYCVVVGPWWNVLSYPVKGLNRLHTDEEMAGFNYFLLLYPQKPNLRCRFEIHAEIPFSDYVNVFFFQK